MGRLEKIVVLTVLFVVALILAISLNQGDKKASQGVPVASVDPAKNAAAATPGAQPAGAGNAAVNAAGTPGAPAGVMNTAVQPEARPAPGLNRPAAQPAAGGVAPQNEIKPVGTLPVGSGLKTREGLEESLFNDLFLYTWKVGDSYPVLAERFYGSQKQALRLRTANEGRTEATLKPGDKIFVPNIDAGAPQQQQQQAAAGQGAPAAGVAGPSAAPAKKGALTADGFYVVQKGDVLGTISQKVYGTSKKWQKIFDANRDVLKDANSLKVGMKLRIPE